MEDRFNGMADEFRVKMSGFEASNWNKRVSTFKHTVLFCTNRPSARTYLTPNYTPESCTEDLVSVQ